MNAVQVLNFQQNSVRTVADNKGELWFLANDVCEILGYTNPRRTVDLHCKSRGVTKRYTPTASGEQEMTYINEPNLYRLIIKSRKPAAEAFEEWVMETVLPAIRKTGGYQITPKTTADDRTGLRQAVAALVGRKGIDYSSAYSMIHQRFNVESIEDLPAGKLPEAVAYVHALTLHTGLTGEVLDAPPKAEPKLPIDGNSLADIAAMVYYGTWMIESGKDISAPLKQLGCRQAVTMWTVWHETRPILKRSAAALEVLRGYADKDASDRIAACLEGIYGKATVR
ncbi:TPA: Bro-N domain-containing protein [Neisseria gonorrhoeae]|uniref:BRO-N domain-containing protein n=1 Tax=Neisseria gonorrhoeae TaxID=485 RepID=UPI000B245906|nr:Bro-N domain-containing protein [Neisseria gonorrhoeae]MDO6046433.1 Bro-N domain-containing protein [Neisseria gonorrhoeae]MDO6050260.1 Bro-N domain-containing protein [Neisseria gonorrhoeae]MDO6056248.1 Bro-N domain-containing protein [Neisseria gonorrhoeae]MDO6083994.1 Bro-N domain-containing protein [Neisseria gonorrhoeae]MDO6087964.1 Bro-N domain-containing protein [Neisseria gonorrhoeae]